jgi:hypothetical protein
MYIIVIYKNRKYRQSNRFPNAQLDAQTSRRRHIYKRIQGAAHLLNPQAMKA